MKKSAFLVLIPAVLTYDQTQASRKSKSDAEKIASALDAGPKFVTRKATVLDYPTSPSGEFRVLRTGTNGWTCLLGLPEGAHDEPGRLDQVFLQFMKDRMAARTPNVQSVGISYIYGGKWAPNKSHAMGSGSEFHVGPHIMTLGLDQKLMQTLKQDGSHGEPHVNHLPGRSELFLVIPIPRAGRCASSPHRWPSNAILGQLNRTRMDSLFFATPHESRYSNGEEQLDTSIVIVWGRKGNICRITRSECSETQAPAKKAGEFLIGGDLHVTRLGFGAMRITGDGIWGEPADRAEAIRVLRRAVELGINFIDTADSYGPGVSEEIIAEALHPYRAHLVIATKGGFDRPGPNRWVENGKPEHLRSACEGSLRRLRLDRIDLYQLHRIDPKVPVEDQLGTLKDLQAQGKIKHIGLSEVNVRQIQHARTIVPIVSVQNRYSITDRGSEDVLGYCEKEGMAFIPWFPLAAGRVSGAHSPISSLAARLKATPSQVALAWLLARSPVMLPIPGTSKVKHLEENVAAPQLQIDTNRWQELERMALAS